MEERKSWVGSEREASCNTRIFIDLWASVYAHDQVHLHTSAYANVSLKWICFRVFVVVTAIRKAITIQNTSKQTHTYYEIITYNK